MIRSARLLLVRTLAGEIEELVVKATLAVAVGVLAAISSQPSFAAATVPIDVVVTLDLAEVEVHRLHQGQATISIEIATGDTDTQPGLRNLRQDHQAQNGQAYVGGVVVATGDWNGD